MIAEAELLRLFIWLHNPPGTFLSEKVSYWYLAFLYVDRY
jgi:hypothetical protein